MIDVQIKTKVDITATLELNEGHLKALDALIGYGHKSFLEMFYKNLGKAYMQPYEKDLIELFNTLGGQLPSALHGVRQAREKLQEKHKCQNKISLPTSTPLIQDMSKEVQSIPEWWNMPGWVVYLFTRPTQDQ